MPATRANIQVAVNGVCQASGAARSSKRYGMSGLKAPISA